jgi:hypothetical protein
MRHIRLREAAVLALTATALAAWAPPALASDGEGDAVEAVGVASRAAERAGHAPAEARAMPFLSDGRGGAEAGEPGGVRVSAPADPANAITISSGIEAGSDADIGIMLPVTSTASAVDVIDGTAVYVDTDADTSFLVDSHAQGTRVMSVMETPEAGSRFEYDFDLPEGAELVPRADGSVDISVGGNGAEVVLGTVAQPWAVDAKGQPVSTQYEVEGRTLTQVVEVGADTAFPVTADPDVRYDWRGWTIYFTKSETTRIAAGAGVCRAILGSIPLPLPLAAIGVSTICLLVFAIAGTAVALGKCVRYTTPPIGAWIGTCDR